MSEASANQTTPLEDVIDRALDQTSGDTVSVANIVEAFGNRSFGPFFVIAGLFVLLPPMGAVPGLPAIAGLASALLAAQMLFGRDHIWLPRPLRRLSVDREKLRSAREKAGPLLAAIDRPITGRLTWLTDGMGRYIAAMAAVIVSLLLIPMELVPFAVALPGAALCAIGVALIAHDGALMLIATSLLAIAVAIILSVAI